MDNFSGDSRSILTRKMNDLVRVFDRQNSVESEMAVLTQLILSNENPSFYASMIVSLKRSGMITGYAKETNDPSFNIDDLPNQVINKPSTYLVDYQPTTEFLDNTDTRSYSDLASGIDVDELYLRRGSETLVRIIAGR